MYSCPRLPPKIFYEHLAKCQSDSITTAGVFHKRKFLLKESLL